MDIILSWPDSHYLGLSSHSRGIQNGRDSVTSVVRLAIWDVATLEYGAAFQSGLGATAIKARRS